ncbi:Cell wall beta-glucan synthesis [Penicillium vulpinum]|uniref:Yeast cell wall synthesis Kre9/Knh1-like N-terminal domain-containing protein n=1 Tax=Penicillium vulpinum TaxID=29845 RepID=A0A1V6RZQ4_9EURO|nr:Cell wall beta-glucan synthesis [Penicillium vulpinum]KAJ5971341.1 Cell wall beta-glucan synthesis [Penicillium vulpinum]OQE07086.1 hypothetical protein PENVUL_c015G03933 [Penicillium vulpinum]
MYFSKSIALTASFVTLALAGDPLAFTSWPKEPLEAGKPVTLTWIGAAPDQPVTILLRQGSSGDLQDVKPITTEGRNGTFTWTPDNDVKENNTYAFQIRQKDRMNYTALLRSASKPVAHVEQAQDGTEGKVPTTSWKDTTPETWAAAPTTTAPAAAAADPPTGPADAAANPHPQTTEGNAFADQGSHPTTTSTTSSSSPSSTTSKALIASSAAPSGSPSAPPSASSPPSTVATSTKDAGSKTASSTGAVQTGAASIQQSSVQFVMGIAGLLAYLV